MRRAPLLLIIPLLTLAACAEEPEESCSPTVSITATPPTIASGDALVITVDARDFELMDPDSDDEPPAGTNCGGHYNGYIDATEGSPLFQDIEEQITVTVEGDPGEHELIVQLQDHDDVFLVPDVRDTVALTIQ